MPRHWLHYHYNDTISKKLSASSEPPIIQADYGTPA
jgi:hypothetical protein